MHKQSYQRELPFILPLGGTTRLQVDGVCMAPLLNPGETVVVRRQRLYWPGDVLVFVGYDGRLYVHRMLGYVLNPWRVRLLTKADRGSRPDMLVQPEHVVGRVWPHPDGHRVQWSRAMAMRDWAVAVWRLAWQHWRRL